MFLVKSFIVLLSILLLFHFYNVLVDKFNFKYKVREGLENSEPSPSSLPSDSSSPSSLPSSLPSPSPSPSSLTYTDPHLDKDPTYLAITNAANIAFLKSKVDDLTGLKQMVTDLNSKVDTNSQAITALGESLKKTSEQVTGRDTDSKEPLPQATGLNYGNMSGVENSF